jgi:hypothetical protein
MLLHMKEPAPPAAADQDGHREEPFYRSCPEHQLELLNQPGATPMRIQLWCPAGHVIRPYSVERPWWWVVERATRRRVASCCRSIVEWEAWFLDAVRLSSTSGRDREGFSGSVARHRVAGTRRGQEEARERRLARRRRARQRAAERDRAQMEGREPAPWAAIQSKGPKPKPKTVRLMAYQKDPGTNPTWWQRYEARRQAKRDGVPPPEWAKRRKPGRVVGVWRRQPSGGDGAAA